MDQDEGSARYRPAIIFFAIFAFKRLSNVERKVHFSELPEFLLVSPRTLPRLCQPPILRESFFAIFAPWREILGRPIESRKGTKLAKVSVRFT